MKNGLAILAEKCLDGKKSEAIYETIKDFWVKNGDYISIQYTGTESNISRVTKKNKQGIMGKLEQWQIGVNRYYQYLINDQQKNECMLLIRGEHQQMQPINN